MALLKEIEAGADAFTYTVIIHLLRKSNYAHKVIEFVPRMITRGIEPSIFTCTTFLDVMCRANMIKKAREVYQYFFSRSYPYNKRMYTFMIQALYRNNLFVEALNLCSKMEEQS